MKEAGAFDYDSYQDVESIQRLMQSLKHGFEKRKIVFSSDDKMITLYPKPFMKVSVKAKRKEEKCKLQIKISWKEGGIDGPSKTLEVSS